MRVRIGRWLDSLLWLWRVIVYVVVYVFFGVALLVSLMAFEWVSMLKATRRAEAGGYYRYRMCLRLLDDARGSGT